jgi:SnoaL-like domain
MSANATSLDDMLAIWNERDLSRIRGHLEATLTPDVVFVDPTIETHGLDEFEQNVRDFRAKYPQASIKRASGIDSHHNLHRYGWEIAIAEKVFLVGFDVAETAESGKVCKVIGFFGPLPKLSQ